MASTRKRALYQRNHPNIGTVQTTMWMQEEGSRGGRYVLTQNFFRALTWGDVLQFMLEAIAHLVRPQCGEWKVLFAGNAFDRYTL